MRTGQRALRYSLCAFQNQRQFFSWTLPDWAAQLFLPLLTGFHYLPIFMTQGGLARRVPPQADSFTGQSERGGNK